MPYDGREQVILEFQKRRKRMLQSLVLALVLIALALILKEVADEYPALLGVGQQGWTALATTQLVAAIAFALMGFKQYRCPACNEILRGHDKYYFGVIINPDRCPRCNARLNRTAS